MSYLIASAVFLLDQLTKKYISANLSLGQSIAVIKNIFHLSLVHNRGVAFGLFNGWQPFFIILTSLVILYIVVDLCLNSKHYGISRRIAFGLILGGACGNLLDRLRLGYIVDFLDFRIWPVFNAADSAITIGMILLGLELFIKSKTKKQKSKTQIKIQNY